MLKKYIMKKISAIIVVLMVFSSTVYSQPWKLARYEVFGGITAFQYFGDIGGSPNSSNFMGFKDISFSKTRPGITGGVRYQVMKELNVKASFVSGFLSQSDATSTSNVNRNFAFNTLINELTVVGEYYIIPESDQNYYYSIMQVRGGLRHFRQPWSLYVFLGAGGLYYHVTPKENLLNNSQFSDDPSFALVIPGGIGAKFAIMPKVSLGAELCLRYTTSNNLDGYNSVHGKYNDFYNSILFKVNYKLAKSKRTGVKPPSRRRFIF
jgi:hypothetical protein